ncbi:MAG: DUF1015 domain-containing protein [Candidatus Omnitrophica bacterium]|nr:DUF1015 domain-containing protein [Candidatus Omnitrophota bacterium]
MADILPFNGLRYNKKKVKDINKTFAPPYDVISEQEQKDLYKQHEFNVIRLILGKITAADNQKNNRYTRAGKLFSKWIKDQVLIQDEKPSIYLYTQDYQFEGIVKKRIGFIAKMHFEGKGCLPHEHTLAKPKVDRVNLIRAVRANLSPIFSFYIDNKNEIDKVLLPFAEKKPEISYKDSEKITHRFWKIDDQAAIEKVKKLMSKKETFIADGHHRYEVAKSFHEESLKNGQMGADGVMVYFTGFNEQNLSVMPTHRMVKDIPDLEKKIDLLNNYFKITKVDDLNAMLKMQKDASGFSLGMCYADDFYVLKMKDKKLLNKIMEESPEQWRKLDVAMLNKVVFEHIFKLNETEKEEKVTYTRDLLFAVKCVKNKKVGVVFFPNTTKADQVKKIALSGNRMPQKSTYFYPKPITGLVINKF